MKGIIGRERVKMVDILVKKIKEYQYYHRESPNVIYVGNNEWYELMEDVKIFNYINEKDENKFMGINVVEVNRKNYLKVGIVE